ncbi:unnamed protein product [Prunus armeniaca]
METNLSKVNMDRRSKSKRERSRDVIAKMETRLSKMEIAVVEFDQQLDEDVLTKSGFEAVVDELQGQFQGALNFALDNMRLDVQTKLDHFLAELTSLCEEVKDVKGDWALCKEAVLNKTRTLKEPKYFKYLKLEDDEPKINTATLFLTDNALMWWHRRFMKIEQGTFTLETWDEFKKDIMLHFYPENAKYEAKEKLRWLKLKRPDPISTLECGSKPATYIPFLRDQATYPRNPTRSWGLGDYPKADSGPHPADHTPPHAPAAQDSYSRARKIGGKPYLTRQDWWPEEEDWSRRISSDTRLENHLFPAAGAATEVREGPGRDARVEPVLLAPVPFAAVAGSRIFEERERGAVGERERHTPGEREKMRQIGNVKDYVAMFTNLLFEVPSMTDEDKLMYFMSGLQNWAKLELQRRHIQTLSEAIAAAESVVEFKKNDQGDSKFKGKKDNSGSGGGDNKPK